MSGSFDPGASGAGKTTFMDCISGRKNVGRITGDVRVNGHPQVLRSQIVTDAVAHHPMLYRLLVSRCPSVS